MRKSFLDCFEIFVTSWTHGTFTRNAGESTEEADAEDDEADNISHSRTLAVGLANLDSNACDGCDVSFSY